MDLGWCLLVERIERRVACHISQTSDTNEHSKVRLYERLLAVGLLQFQGLLELPCQDPVVLN